MESQLAETDKVIYLDSDILVMGNLAELWDLPMNGSSVMACRDRMVFTLGEDTPWPLETHERSLPYFNSGIFVADLDEWRKLHIQEQAIKFIEQPDIRYRWHDQTILNYLFRGNFLVLDQAWNWQSNELPKSDSQQVQIMHFTTPRKPWKFWDCEFRFRAWRGCYRLCCGSTLGMFLRNGEFKGIAYGLFDGALERFPFFRSFYLIYLQFISLLPNRPTTAAILQSKISWLKRARTPVDQNQERALTKDFVSAIRDRLTERATS